MIDLNTLLTRFDPLGGEIEGASVTKRHLEDLCGCFADTSAYKAALANGNPLLYRVSSCEPAGGSGDLHFGMGMLMPGRIGSEYFMTKGHFHSWREAAEIYIGLNGEGAMLLEHESSGECQLLPLRPNQIIYVPGYTAHRTVNTGKKPLTYLGVYPARAGHDYGSIAASNFRHVVIERNGRPVLLERSELKL